MTKDNALDKNIMVRVPETVKKTFEAKCNERLTTKSAAIRQFILDYIK